MNAPDEQAVLDVVIGADCDPDRPAYGGVRYDSTDAPAWRGVARGVPLLREIADGVIDDFGSPARITWCIRSDLQMREIYGDCAWAATEYADLWSDLKAGGDELAWHPHVWRWDRDAGCWYQEVEDEDWIEECLSAGHRDFSAAIGHAPATSRTGWEFHNNTTMTAIRQLGIRMDFSAIPGRHTPGGPDRWGSRFNCYVDWRGTPEEPYLPSPADYRRAADHGERDGLWELPMSVLHSSLLRLARIGRKAFAGRPKALGELVNTRSSPSSSAGGNKLYITMPPALFSRLAVQQLERARTTGWASLVTALHPDEMCATGSGLTALHHPRHVGANLRTMLRHGGRRGVRIRFTTPARMLGAVGDLQLDRVRRGTQPS
ncbi:MAG: hypothetical protein ACOCZ7_01365 [Armatimonadota bacterium]